MSEQEPSLFNEPKKRNSNAQREKIKHWSQRGLHCASLLWLSRRYAADTYRRVVKFYRTTGYNLYFVICYNNNNKIFANY